MTNEPLIAVPHWRAPTLERTKFYYDALQATGARYLAIQDQDLPIEARGLLLTGGVDVDPRLYGEKRIALTDPPNRQRDAREAQLLLQSLDADLHALSL